MLTQILTCLLLVSFSECSPFRDGHATTDAKLAEFEQWFHQLYAKLIDVEKLTSEEDSPEETVHSTDLEDARRKAMSDLGFNPHYLMETPCGTQEKRLVHIHDGSSEEEEDLGEFLAKIFTLGILQSGKMTKENIPKWRL